MDPGTKKARSFRSGLVWVICEWGLSVHVTNVVNVIIFFT